MNETLIYKCSLCQKFLPKSHFDTRGNDRPRPVTSRCKDCRKEARNKKLYVQCPKCLLFRSRNSNGTCRGCIETLINVNGERLSSKERGNRRSQQLADSGFCRYHPDRPSIRKGICSECNLRFMARSCINRAINCAKKQNLNLTHSNIKKDKHTEEIQGCTFEEWNIRIESTFTSGMTWINHGEWHVDHIRPLASFDDLNDPEQFKQACHYTNLQALWATDNLAKSDHYTP